MFSGGDAAIADVQTSSKAVTAVMTTSSDLLDHLDSSTIESTGDGLPPASLSDELERGGGVSVAGANGEPVFDPTTERNVTVLVGRTAHLHCRVRFLGNRTVSIILPLISPFIEHNNTLTYSQPRLSTAIYASWVANSWQTQTFYSLSFHVTRCSLAVVGWL